MRTQKNGFSLIEVLVGITLIAIALIGLAQLFTLSVMNNLRSNDLSNATFLTQQRIDYLRTLTAGELNNFPQISRGESYDEQIDLNQDGTIDCRRITQVDHPGAFYEVSVLVFPPSQLSVPRATLLASPDTYKVKAWINTLIGR
jgi:prepilin-type N-terminal cleavage/methylation domain-containing protein